MPSPVFTDLLAQLMGRMPGVSHVVGRAADAEHSQLDRFVWIPGPVQLAPIAYRPHNAEAPWAKLRTFDVSIYGGTLERLDQLFDGLVGWLDLLVGPPLGDPEGGDGYAIGASKPGPRESEPAVYGWGMTVPVVLKYPVVRAVWTGQVVTSITRGIIAENGDGSDQSSVVPPP